MELQSRHNHIKDNINFIIVETTCAILWSQFQKVQQWHFITYAKSPYLISILLNTVSQFIKWMCLCSAISENVKLCPSSISNDICIYGVFLNIPFSLNRNDLKQLYYKEKRNRKKKRKGQLGIKSKGNPWKWPERSGPASTFSWRGWWLELWYTVLAS